MGETRPVRLARSAILVRRNEVLRTIDQLMAQRERLLERQRNQTGQAQPGPSNSGAGTSGTAINPPRRRVMLASSSSSSSSQATPPRFEPPSPPLFRLPSQPDPLIPPPTYSVPEPPSPVARRSRSPVLQGTQASQGSPVLQGPPVLQHVQELQDVDMQLGIIRSQMEASEEPVAPRSAGSASDPTELSTTNTT